MSRREPRNEGLASRIRARHVVVGIVGVVLLWFALANSARVEVDFLFATRDVRLIYVILISAALGAVLGWFGGLFRDRD
jgi:uncharacterized integral membrane protein